MNSFPKSVTVVIPAFNEEGNLKRLFQFLEETFHQLGYQFPVLLVDDGSEDNTPLIVEDLKQRYDFLTVVRHPHRRGVAEVWKTALSHVKTDWIFWGQADLESDPRSDIPLLLSAWSPGVDGVAGWRQNRQDGKLFTSKIANKVCRSFLGLKIHDMNWIKLVRRDLISPELLDLTTHRYLLAALAGFGHTIIEVPTPWHTRYSGTTKFGKGRLLTSSLDFIKLLSWFIQFKVQAKIKLSVDQLIPIKVDDIH